MQCRKTRLSRARSMVLAASLVVLASLAMAGPSFAGPPTAGVACQPSDGKISGRGASFQTAAQNAFINGYRLDVCGPTPGSPVDVAGNNMLIYNQSGVPNGSGNGQVAMSCRTDAYGGSDIPYDSATLTVLNGTKGGDIPGASPASGQCAANTYVPPFGPGSAQPYPDAGDQSNIPLMVFPVAGSAVTIGVHFAAAGAGNVCTSGTSPSSVQFSADTLQKIFAGKITNWNDSAIVADNPGWNTACTGQIKRIVRSSKSGTTQIFKNFLKNVDGSTALCDGTNTWSVLAQDANNTTWPQTGGTCPSPTNLTTASSGGNLSTAVNTTDGAIGYADLPDWNGRTASLLAKVASATGGLVGPGSPTGQANCISAFSSASLPGTTNNDAISLGVAPENWALDGTGNGGRSYMDLTYQGSGYPICGVTFGMVFTGLRDTTGSNAISRLTNDQRRTLYSYFTYVLSPAAQFRLTVAGYDQLPSTWLTKLRQGFQANF